MTYRLSGRLLNKGLMGAVAALLLLMSLLAPARAELVQFVYTSDQHYGITRKGIPWAGQGVLPRSQRGDGAGYQYASRDLASRGRRRPAGQPVQWPMR